MSALVDVVVPTRDRPRALEVCLRALAQQSMPDIRVIITDDGSRVPVAEAVDRDILDALDVLILRNEQSRGPAAARNQAVVAGDAPYIAFIDDDVEAAPDLVARQLALLRGLGPRAILIGPLLAPEGWRPTAWNRWEAEQLLVEYARMERGEYEPTWRQFHTGNAFLERETFESVGGFDEQFTRAEDIEFALRAALAGHRFVFNAGAVGRHDAFRSRSAWLRIPTAYAEFDVLMDRLHPEARWLRIVHRERGLRHPVVRAARLVARSSMLSHPLTWGMTVAAGGCHRVGALRASMALLSLAYDLRYETAFRRALRGAASLPAEESAVGVPRPERQSP